MPPVKSYHRSPSRRKKEQRNPGSLRKLWVFSLGMGILVILFWAYFHVSTVLDASTQELYHLLAQGGFKLEDVVVEGRKRTDKTRILKDLDLERNKPLFSIDIASSKEKLEGLPWIKAASVERRFPSTLIIRISEKEPIALWQNKGKTYLVDRDGALVETQEAHNYKNLLYVTGQKAPLELRKLIEILERFPEVKARVTSATHLRHARWDLRLDGAVDVKLPESNPEESLVYFLDLEKHHHLIRKDITTIDMRLPDQLILRLKPDTVLKKNTSGKDV